MILPRSFPVFAITFACAFAVLYLRAAAYNLALFTYDAATSEFFSWFGGRPRSPHVLVRLDRHVRYRSVCGRRYRQSYSRSVGPTTVVRLVVGHPDGR